MAPSTTSPPAHLRRAAPHPRALRRTVDATLATVLLACSFPGTLITWPGHALTVPWWPGVLLAGVSCGALPGRRGRPRTTVAVTLACAIAACALGYLLTVLLLAPLMVALHSLAVRTDRRTANSFTFTGIALLVATGLIAGPVGEPLVLKLIGPTAWLLLPTSLGTATRLRGAYLEAVRARAEHAERTRDEEARRRVAEERMRIARDLHDVVAHHLVLANLQATTVGRFVRARPDEAERLITELSRTTTSALRELKSTVGLLRAEGTEKAETAERAGGAKAAERRDDMDSRPVASTPGLAQLPQLAASFASAGLAVTVTGTGDPRPLSAGADLTAYRIAQEALTNVTKHAATRTAEVHLVYTTKRLRLTVLDDGGPRPGGEPSPGGGYGLLGMRERAHSAGGLLRVGPRPGGGFEVVAELPLPSVEDVA
ncbi:sensor histidine kinase [Streptomyces griseiscabiei]|uniref:histidine kinase n=1 Tax=Streptomyces griseiscabiei TaxID=2993540 RepID=A0ABU4LD22_9ACTN|nr:histidine kinase [Streptomyces griseiscabiei]MBZ3906591.1 sensor histidine kinase [Streptomyces griseiscabiei]MDX2913655.1 histidine kinase [Streptomyces griseiscabiei]